MFGRKTKMQTIRWLKAMLDHQKEITAKLQKELDELKKGVK